MFVCLYLFIISNNSNITKDKIKIDMDENILVNFCFRKVLEQAGAEMSQAQPQLGLRLGNVELYYFDKKKSSL